MGAGLIEPLVHLQMSDLVMIGAAMGTWRHASQVRRVTPFRRNGRP
jgi:hypothetical protein